MVVISGRGQGHAQDATAADGAENAADDTGDPAPSLACPAVSSRAGTIISLTLDRLQHRTTPETLTLIETDLTRTVNAMLDRLEGSFVSQRRLLDDVGHELRTPITIIQGHLELQDSGDPQDVQAVRDIALDELDRMRLLVDDLVSPEVVAHASPNARIVYVGKRGGCKSTPQAFIEKLMLMAAREGENVVRLKGGDPFIFGRGGEEVEHLRAAGIAVDVVNGVTSGLAAATSLGVPLTHRDHAQGVIFITGHAQKGADAPDWRQLAAMAHQARLTLDGDVAVAHDGGHVLCRATLGAPFRQAAVQHGHVGLAHQAERPPHAKGAAHVGIVIDDHLMPVADASHYSFKYVNGHPGNTRHGLATVMAFGALADVDTGLPTVLSELTITTAIRTAATSVMAAKRLARSDARTMALIGNGAQSEFQALAFHALLGIDTVRLFDIDERATDKLVRNLALAAPALRVVRAGTVFTTHTPVPAGIDRFDVELVRRHLTHELVPGVDVARVLELGREDDPAIFNMAQLGFSIAQRANETTKALGGKVSYLWATFAVFAKWQNSELRLTVDGESRTGHMHDVVVANGKTFGGGMIICPDAEPDDGLFDVLTIGDLTKRDLLVDGLRSLDLEVYPPEATYFVTTDVRAYGYEDGMAFCLALPERAGVVAIPSQVFYDDHEEGRHKVRWAFCKDTATVEDGVRRLQRADLHA